MDSNMTAPSRYQEMLINSGLNAEVTGNVELANYEYCNLCKKALVAVEFLIPHVENGEKAMHMTLPWWRRLWAKPAPSEIPNLKNYIKQLSDVIDEVSVRKPTDVNTFPGTVVQKMESYIALADAVINMQSLIRKT